ncbi:MAG: oligosaccharide flippase family protein, partial [Clostridia bacterium]|nr:oligosaccharide flippase family protein [Clostridia bacterium]
MLMKKSRKKSNIYKSAAQVTVFSTFEKALSFIYRIILSRSIGAEGLGIYQICLSVFSVFLTAASSGIPVTVSRLIAKNTAVGNVKGKHSVVSAGVLCTLLFTVPAALVLFLAKDLYAFMFPDRDCALIFMWLLPGLILTSIYAIMRGSFWGNKQFLPYSIIELAENAVMVACGCVLIG